MFFAHSSLGLMCFCPAWPREPHAGVKAALKLLSSASPQIKLDGQFHSRMTTFTFTALEIASGIFRTTTTRNPFLQDSKLYDPCHDRHSMHAT